MVLAVLVIALAYPLMRWRVRQVLASSKDDVESVHRLRVSMMGLVGILAAAYAGELVEIFDRATATEARP